MGRREIPGTARAGIGILIVGAILVGIGTYQEREPLSVYGAIMAFLGFILYITTSIYVARKTKQKKDYSR